eukprot:TRINITY_DN3837_c0_g1_i1.p1 TRINITY_DN3837_c0_g1~~TRINITY_DN3837_c0_g1_i1.p1  ORF type:complete len:593 (-),score=151.28 TRINITY_DN3837_c0_g1_i1:54-1583(-)
MDRPHWADPIAIHPMDRFKEDQTEFHSDFSDVWDQVHHPPQLHESEMHQIWEDQQRHHMVNEFEEYQRHMQWDGFFAQARETEQWVDEFYGRAPIRPVESLRDVAKEISSIHDPKLQNTQFMSLMRSIGSGKVDVFDNELVEKEGFNVEDLATEFENSHLSTADRWANSFHDEKLEEQMAREFDENLQVWPDEFQNMDQENLRREYEEYMANALVGEYQFTDGNPYAALDDPLEKGLELFQEGRLEQAILAFEAELARNPTSATGWQHLGLAHAENDKDGKAITCLQKAAEYDPQNADIKMALAVSYTNELNRELALDTLRTWIEEHPQYKHIQYQEEAPRDFRTQFRSYHTALTNMFIEAARMRPSDPDADVQTALGLLFNITSEYDKAVDCFRSALSVKPDDYLLWNKLGATLANSERPQEAVGCYFNALQHRPSYVRARSNLGISFMGLRQYDRAAQYFLGGLSMHPEATHIWSTLRLNFVNMGRDDLVNLVEQRDVNLFRGEFEF